MAQALFVTREDIVKYTVMNGNVDTDKFIQFVKIAQDTQETHKILSVHVHTHVRMHAARAGRNTLEATRSDVRRGGVHLYMHIYIIIYKIFLSPNFPS